MPLLRAGRARVTSQISVSARGGTIRRDDLQWQGSYDGRRAYAQSKIAFGLFALELARRSRVHGWSITSNLAHPGVVPTDLLAARPEVGRDQDTPQIGLIRTLSRWGLLGTIDTALLPALYRSGRLYGPDGFGNLRGAPAEQRLHRPLRSTEEAERVWAVSEQLTSVSFGQGVDGAAGAPRPRPLRPAG